jgi:electron-transferring-flavoprotein dehydrogenase
MNEVQRDVMEYDVAIVGGGPAGLACAIRLKQLAPGKTVCLLEKAASIGAHSLSGAVLEPGPLEQLLPEFKTEYPGMKVAAAEDDFRVLTPQGSFKPIPDFLVNLLPKRLTSGTPVNNHGNYIISLGQLTPWLAAKAEALGVDVFPGFAASTALFDDRGRVKGVRVGDMGLLRDGVPGPNYTPGVDIHAARSPRRSSRNSTSPKATARKPSPWATRSCGNCHPVACGRGASSIALAGRPIPRPTPAASSTTSTTIGCTWVTSSASTIRTRG